MFNAKSSWFAFLLSLACALAGAAEFPAADKATVQELGKQLEGQCHKEMAQTAARRNNQPDTANEPVGVAKWLSQLTDDASYCSCLSTAFVQRASPETLRNEQDMVVLVKKAGTSCVLPKLRTGFPQVCRAMMTPPASAAGAVPFPPDRIAAFCGCVQADIDAITVESFEGFVRNTIAAYAAYRQSLQPSGEVAPSLVSSMNRCRKSELPAR